MLKSDINKVVLAYSGGLDTSIILQWLQDVYDCEVVTFTADIGQGEEVEPARAKAQAMGIKEIYIEDLREEFARDFVFPMFRANAVYEGEYLLGTSIARPLIAKRLVEIANATGADAISHGATGKGNDQVRFELGAYALKEDVQVIAPWREWDLLSREKLMQYAAEKGIEIDYVQQGKKSPYSMDANLLHISYEGDVLEDPWVEPEDDMWRWSVSPEEAPKKRRGRPALSKEEKLAKQVIKTEKVIYMIPDEKKGGYKKCKPELGVRAIKKMELQAEKEKAEVALGKALVQTKKGADIAIDVWPDMPHDFQAYDSMTASSRVALMRITQTIDSHLTAGKPPGDLQGVTIM